MSIQQTSYKPSLQIDQTQSELFGEKFMKYLYSILNEKEDLFDPSKLEDLDLSTDGSKLQSIESEVLKPYIEFYQQILSNMTFVDKTTFFNRINKNLDEIAEKNKSHEIIFISTGDDKSKSNFWLTMYSIRYLSAKGIKLSYAYNILANIVPVDEEAFGMGCETQRIEKAEYEKLIKKTNKKLLLVFCDDISYSGNQLSGHVAGYCFPYSEMYGMPQLDIPDNVEIYFNLYGFTDGSINKLRDAVSYKDRSKLIFPKDYVTMKTFKNVLVEITNVDLSENLTDLYKAIVDRDCFSVFLEQDKPMVRSMFASRFPNSNDEWDLSLSYLFFKYPDAQSTVSNMCFFEIPQNYVLNYKTHKNNLDLSNLIKLYEKPYKIDLDKILKIDLSKGSAGKFLKGESELVSDLIVNVGKQKLSLIPTIKMFKDKSDVDAQKIILENNGSCKAIWDKNVGSFYKQDYNLPTKNSVFDDYKTTKQFNEALHGGNSLGKLAYYDAKFKSYVGKYKNLN